MTQVEYIEAMAEIQQRNKELNRAHTVQMEIIERQHRENVQAENDRYGDAKRKEIAEWQTRKDAVAEKELEIKKARAVTRMEEEKALAAAMGEGK